MITIVNGDLLDSEAQVIAHQVNCRGVAKSGIAKQIMKKYLMNKTMYAMICKRETPRDLLGTAYCVDNNEGPIVANLFGQDNYGRTEQHTDYWALNDAMAQLRKFMDLKGLTSVAFPYGIGCGLGGGDWNVVCSMIDKHFKHDDIECYLYKLK